MYKNIGFKRVVLGREISLNEIKRIKDAVPDMELETFVHGAMCIAYSGRCLMSAYLTGRSAQSGACAHTCRWNFKVGTERKVMTPKEFAESGELLLEEEQRPGEFFPVYEGDDYTAIMSSKNLCMIDHLADLKATGVDSIKIEGRMKSVYYVSMATRAYRKALDALDGKITASEAAPYIAELENVSHRNSTTGFYYNKSQADETTIGASDSKYQLAAQIGDEVSNEEFDKLLAEGQKRYSDFKQSLDGMHPAAREACLKDLQVHTDRNVVPFEKKEGWHMYPCTAVNMIRAEDEVEIVSTQFCSLTARSGEWEIISSETGLKLNWGCNGHPAVIYTKYELSDGSLLRTLDSDYVDYAL